MQAGAKVTCYSPGDLAINGVTHWQTLPEPSLHVKEGGKPNTAEHLEKVAEGILKLSKPGDVLLFNHPDHYRYLKKRLGTRYRLRHHIAEVAHWIDAGAQRNIIYPSANLQKLISRPGETIPHGENLIFTSPTDKVADYLFFAGRITKDKGLDIALEACKELKIPLVLAGPLNDKLFAERIIQDQCVQYLGELTYDELAPYYRNAAALIYMTQYVEPFGLSVIEAMATGCPVLTTGKGGTGETVIDGKTGYFCQSHDDIVKKYDLLKNIDRNACIERAKQYSIPRMSSAYLAFFKKMH